MPILISQGKYKVIVSRTADNHFGVRINENNNLSDPERFQEWDKVELKNENEVRDNLYGLDTEQKYTIHYLTCPNKNALGDSHPMRYSIQKSIDVNSKFVTALKNTVKNLT